MGNSAIAVQPRFHVREVTPSPARRFGDLVAESVAMRELFAIMERVGPTDVGVLIEGESGTGKELAARALHQQSARSHAPYVVCFDEIGELPLDLQPKLLRVLETGEVRAVGDDVVRKVDVRVLASTNRELGAEARRGSFRSDLLYRLEVVKLRMPPLRYRPEDVAGLVGHMLSAKLPPEDVIGGDNLRKLVAYSWPGNVRELRNVLDRAVALASAPARFAELVFNLGPLPSAPLTIGHTFPGVASRVPYKEAKRQLLASFDRAYVEALLARQRGNISAAAAAAGLSRKALYDLIRRCTGEVDDS